MPKLNCSASSCYYQSEGLCCASSIDINAEAGLTNSRETCCNTFSNKNDSMLNSNHNPTAEISINCSAENCVHNNNCNCHASSVNIAGYSASNCFDTECSSFCTK